MSGDLRVSTSSDQVWLGEDFSHSLSIAVKRSAKEWFSRIACRVKNYKETSIIFKVLWAYKGKFSVAFNTED